MEDLRIAKTAQRRQDPDEQDGQRRRRRRFRRPAGTISGSAAVRDSLAQIQREQPASTTVSTSETSGERRGVICAGLAHRIGRRRPAAVADDRLVGDLGAAVPTLHQVIIGSACRTYACRCERCIGRSQLPSGSAPARTCRRSSRRSADRAAPRGTSPRIDTITPIVQPIASRGPIRVGEQHRADRRHDQVAEHQQHAGDRHRRVTTKPNDA